MLKVNWLRLLLCMLVTAVISILLEKYFNVHTNSAFIAGLGLIVGKICIRWEVQNS